MPTTLKTITILCGGSMLLGCAVNPKPAPLTLVPYSAVRHADESALGYYTLGRYFHGARRLDQAQQAYQQALALQPQDPRTRSALATLYAERGEYQKAIPLLRELAETSANASYLFSNLGYAYYLNGEYGEAVTALEKATRLDPSNQRAANNLDAARAKLVLANASGKPATATESEPPSLQLVQQRSALAAPAVPAAAVPAAQANATTEIRQIGPYSYEIKNVRQSGIAPMSMVPPPLPPQPQPTATAGSTFRLVIANGNGIPWLATKVGRALAGNGMPAARLVNLKPYREPRTTITYRDGYRDQALQLGRALDREPRLARETGLHSGADVQLTLGKDATSPMSLFGPGSARPRLAKKDMPLADPRS